MSQLSMLFLDDKDFTTQALVAQYLRPQWKVELVSTYEESLCALRKYSFDVLLLDNDLGPQSPTGVQLIAKYRQEFPYLVIVMMTNTDDLQKMKEALELGAEDYLVKYSSTCEEVSIRIPECLKRARNRKMLADYQAELTSHEPLILLGNSQKVRTLRESIRIETAKNSHLVFIGEIGSGRSSLARYFWKLKEDPYRPFVPFALSGTHKLRLEEDLFGDASRRNGVFYRAHRGDLFLAGFDQISKSLQKKIIAAALSQTIHPKGTPTPFTIQTRLFLTAHRLLECTKKNHTFRTIVVPPLRERQEDIEWIVNGYLSQSKYKPYFLSNKSLAFLKAQPWPGNLKQLFHLLELVTSELKSSPREKIEVSDLVRAERHNSLHRGSLELSLPQHPNEIDPAFFEIWMNACEQQLMTHVLSLFKGHAVKTATALGMSKSTFYCKLGKFTCT